MKTLENRNQRELREIVQALADLESPMSKFDIVQLRGRAQKAVENQLLTRDEQLAKAREASVVTRQKQTRKDRLTLLNIIRDIQKRDPGLSYAHIDVELRKRGIKPPRAAHWTYRTLRAIINP